VLLTGCSSFRKAISLAEVGVNMESSGVWRMTCESARDKFSDGSRPGKMEKRTNLSAGRMWKNSDRSIRRNDCENCRETPRVIARDRSDYCGTREQRGMGSVTRPAGASDGSKTQEDRMMANDSVDTTESAITARIPLLLQPNSRASISAAIDRARGNRLRGTDLNR
jgi:hypothetical protein